MTRYLSLADTERLDLRMRDVVPVVEDAFRRVAEGRAAVVPRVRLTHPPLGAGSHGEGRPWTRDVRIIPGAIEGIGFGIRVGTALRAAPGAGPDRAAGVVLLFFDWETMRLSAAISDHLVHAVRSTAPNGVAAKHLAPSDARTLGLVGSGRLARWAAEAVCAVRPIEHVTVWSPDEDHRAECARYLADRLGTTVETEPSAEAAVRDAAIVVTATTAREPVIRGEWLATGATVLSNRPEELGADVLRGARVVTTYLAGTFDHVPPYRGLAEVVARGEMAVGDVAELAEIVAGRTRGRRSAEERVVCLNPAFGVLDAALAAHVHERASALGIGTELSA